MSVFKGYFFGFVNSKGEVEPFPMKYIQWESYDSLPCSREEIRAKRDDYTRDLIRVTASGTKSSFNFKLRPLQLSDKMIVQKWFTDRESDALQRKIRLIYWNDEKNTYLTSDFYRADMKFQIMKVTEDNIWYKECEVSLVEY